MIDGCRSLHNFLIAMVRDLLALIYEIRPMSGFYNIASDRGKNLELRVIGYYQSACEYDSRSTLREGYACNHQPGCIHKGITNIIRLGGVLGQMMPGNQKSWRDHYWLFMVSP